MTITGRRSTVRARSQCRAPCQVSLKASAHSCFVLFMLTPCGYPTRRPLMGCLMNIGDATPETPRISELLCSTVLRLEWDCAGSDGCLCVRTSPQTVRKRSTAVNGQEERSCSSGPISQLLPTVAGHAGSVPGLQADSSPALALAGTGRRRLRHDGVEVPVPPVRIGRQMTGGTALPPRRRLNGGRAVIVYRCRWVEHNLSR